MFGERNEIHEYKDFLMFNADAFEILLDLRYE